MSAHTLDVLDAIARTTPRSALHTAAQWYAANFGWRVFPLHSVRADGRCTCGADPCGTDNKSAGKHPRIANWCLDASLDPDTIAGWWRQWPDAGVAIATGRGLVVVDVDPRSGGDDGLVDLRRTLGELPHTVEVLTGGGGRHLYLSTPPGVDVRNSASELSPGVDVRGAGGYVVAPPSSHRSGRAYCWEASSDPDDVDLAPLPPAWLDAMKGKAGAPRVRTATPDDPIPAGTRNTTLARLAGHLRAAGFGLDAITAALLAENAARCVPPMEESEVRAIAVSAHRYAPGHRDPGATLPVTSERAGGEACDRAYRAILDALTLSAEHREALRGWGLDGEACGARSLDARGRSALGTAAVRAVGEDAARRVPGIVRVEEPGRAWWSLAGAAGIVLPVRDRDGRVAALLAGVETFAGGRIIGSAHKGGPAGVEGPHVPQRARDLLDAGAPRALLTVGVLRAELATAVLGIPCIGAPTLTTWRAALDTLTCWPAMRIAVVFPAGEGVTATAAARAEGACRDAIRARGRTPEEVRGFNENNGFDGYLAARRRGELR